MKQEQFIRETIHAHYLMQFGSYVSKLMTLPTARLAFTRNFPSIWYNSAFDIRSQPGDIEQLIDQIETLMGERNRNPSIYVSPATQPANLGKLLLARGYQAVETEAWTISDLRDIAPPEPLPPNITIDRVQTKADFEIFADVYRRSYPSAGVEAKIQACFDAWQAGSPLIDLHYFVGRYKGEPASMTICIQMGQYSEGGTSATIKEFRRKGLTVALQKNARRVAAKNGAKYQFGQAVSGSAAERLFNSLGYHSLYTRTCYTKEII